MSTKDRYVSVGAAQLRDPIVPLDFDGWFRRQFGLIGRNGRGLLALGLVPSMLGSLYQIVIEIVRPSVSEMADQLRAAGSGTPDGYVGPVTVFKIVYWPLVPTAAMFVPLILAVGALCYGAAYYWLIRRSNGQPATLARMLRAAAHRVPPVLGWFVLSGVVAIGLFYALLVPGTATGNPWLNMIGPVLGFAELVVVIVILVPTLLGVSFLDRAGLKRCAQLVKGRFWFTCGRATLITVGYVVYFFAVRCLMTLLLLPFGGAQSLGSTGRAVAVLVSGLLGAPLFAYVATSTLVTYAELRFRQDRSTSTHSLARQVRL